MTIPQEAFEELRAFARDGRTGSVALTFHFSEGALEMVDVERHRRLRVKRAAPTANPRVVPSGNGLLSA